jgi:hypothetical protein
MFGDFALRLLKLMGRRETVPSAIEQEDIPKALEMLRTGLTIKPEVPEKRSSEEGEGEESTVAIATRAMPLIELLEAALKEDVAVLWEEG